MTSIAEAPVGRRPDPRRLVPAAAELLRFTGLAVGVFILANLAGEAIRGPFDTLHDWISLPSPAWLRHLGASVTALFLLAHAVTPLRSRVIRRAGALLFLSVALLALADAAGFYAALARGTIHTPAVVPASILVAACFTALALDLERARGPRPPWGRHRVVLAATIGAAVAAALPLVRMATFGPTRYDRSADCAVVFGARVWDDGTPSLALADRVDEAIRLYHRGMVKHLVMSGAVDRNNGFSEPRVMRARAEAAGVPAPAISVDEAGFDTAATVRNASILLDRYRFESALVVSHYYHEPRVKMLFDRAGVRAYTVPARMTRRLHKEPYFILREIAAFYHSFLLE